jgi:hypothetical protein
MTQPQTTLPANGERPLTGRVFGVVARGQTWRNFVHLWLDFPLGLFYFVFLVTALSVGIGTVIVWVGVPILLLTAAAWWCFAAFERGLARGLLRADVPRAPRPWRRGESVLGRLKAHFGASVTYTDLAYLVVKFPLGVISFVLCVTGAAMVVAFVGAPVFQATDTLYLFGQRIDSWVLALALVPVGLVALIGWLHLLNGWAWVECRVAEGLLRGDAAPDEPAAAGMEAPVLTPATAAWQGAAACTPGQVPVVPAASAPVAPAQLPQPVWVQTPYGWQPVQPPEGWVPVPAQPPQAAPPAAPPAQPAQPPASPQAPADTGAPEQDA